MWMLLQWHDEKRENLAKDVVYIPDLCARLLFVSELRKKGYQVSFDVKKCRISYDSLY